jgi:uncharacterized pyridoxamine 5'-phosphate oxidase family protein
MREQKILTKDFEFYFPDLDNMVLVESLEDGNVRVRFTKNNLSEKRKVFFIRELAAEGFIPDNYQWFSGSTIGSASVTWVKDYSWVKVPAAVTRRTNRVMRLLLVASCILWLAMMRVLIVSSRPQPAANPPTDPPSTSVVSVPRDAINGRVGDSLIPRQPLAELKSEH